MSGKILIVDDEELIREAMADLLEVKGYDVTIAQSGNDALSKVDDTFDLVISDVRMDDGDGIYLAEELYKKFSKDLPVIFVTGYLDAESTKVSENVIEVIKKPVRFNKLAQFIEDALK